MLRDLEVRNILLIDELTLSFEVGLNVLTGETGAGKSILLDALGFVLGWRGRAELVREGADMGEVTAVFEVTATHPAQAVLEEAGWDPVDELILRRVNTKDGRKTAFVNDRRCSGDLLRALSDTLVELHGQHDDRGLLNKRGHLALLDSYAGTDLGPLQTAWSNLSAARKAVDVLRERLAKATEEQEFLAHAVMELNKISPEVGEEEVLDTRRRLMQASGKIREDIAKAFQAMGSDGADGMLLDATRWLETVSDQAEGRLDAGLAALQRASEELGVAQAEVQTCLEHLDFDPHELERVEERLFAIRGLARKHDILPDQLSELAERLRAELDQIEAGDAEMERLKAELEAAQSAFDQEASRV
ncbi:MAG: AAA family ATPase, partial [Pseudomonadota bacterium]